MVQAEAPNGNPAWRRRPRGHVRALLSNAEFSSLHSSGVFEADAAHGFRV